MRGYRIINVVLYCEGVIPVSTVSTREWYCTVAAQAFKEWWCGFVIFRLSLNIKLQVSFLSCSRGRGVQWQLRLWGGVRC